jgi:AdoMet-dependent rRNA methyltransferase SPB1
MQLQMTAPLDIGLEQTDAVLGHGQEDVFDLESAERIPRRIGSPDFTDTDDQDNDIEQRKDDNSSDDESVHTDGEQNSRVQALEDDLDGLYETYQERLAERDAKYKVRMARQDDKRREEWSGIDKNKAQGDTDEEGGGGGWDEMEQRKAAESESDFSSADEEDELSSSQSLSKRKQPRQQETSRKKARLLTSLKEPQTKIQSSIKTDVWFSQDIFGELGHLSEDDDGETTSPEPSLDVGVRSYLSPKLLILTHHQVSVSEDDEPGSQPEFEVVPREQDDTEMWDVNNPNEDELKSAQIRSKSFFFCKLEALQSTDRHFD